MVTLAFATLTGVIYFFWWDKPLDVRCAIPVQLLKGRIEEIHDNVVNEDTGSQIISSDEGKEGDEKGITLPNPLPPFRIQDSTSTPDPGSISVQVKEGDEKSITLPNSLPSFPIQGGTPVPDPGSISVQLKQGDEKGTILPNPLPSFPVREGDEKGATLPNALLSFPVQGDTSIPDPGSISVQVKEGDEKGDTLPNPLPSPPIQGGTSTPDPGSISVQVKEGDEKGTTLPNPLPSFPIQDSTSTPDPVLTRMQQFQVFRRRARTKRGTVFGLVYVFIVFPLFRFLQAFDDMINTETLGDETLRVPTFYSPPDNLNDTSIAIILGVCVSIVFGAIHCIAWSFRFTTLQERWAWRISAILVSGLPIATIPFTYLLTIFDDKEHKTTVIELYEAILACILTLISGLYIVARIALLVLPFVALRTLVPGAYVQVDWISFLPHI